MRFGILIFGLVFWSAAAWAECPPVGSDGYDVCQHARDTADSLSQNLPYRETEHVYRVSAVAADQEIILKFEFEVPPGSQTSGPFADQVKLEMREETTKAECSNPGGLEFIKHGGRVRFSYDLKNGPFFTMFEIDHCP